MPTIEIASFNSTGLGLNQIDFEVAIIEENELVSHRGLFSDVLQQQKGVIIHIGDSAYKDDKEGGFSAGRLVDWDFEPGYITIPNSHPDDPIDFSGANQQFRFQFLEQYKPDINRLLEIALDKSSIKKVCFLTDYQFGPEKANLEIIYTINDFWTLHDSEGLNLNTMYELYGR